jgi:hypothetical protein
MAEPWFELSADVSVTNARVNVRLIFVFEARNDLNRGLMTVGVLLALPPQGL